jgi:hypothetical protein
VVVVGRSSCNQGLDSISDVVADGADPLEWLARGIGQFPVTVGHPGEVEAGVTAAHRDHDVAGLHRVSAEDFRGGGGDVDAEFGHGGDGDWVDLLGGFGSRGTDLDAISGQVGQQPGGHLRYAG